MAQLDSLRRIAEKLDGKDKDDNIYNENSSMYLARIAEALDGQHTDELRTQEVYLDRIATAVESGAGAYKLRDFTIVNNTSLVLFMMTTFKTKHGIEYASSTIAGNKTVTRTIVGSTETKNGFSKQNILFSVPSGTVNSVTSEGLNIVFTQVGKYLVVEIPLSPKDITLTIA